MFMKYVKKNIMLIKYKYHWENQTDKVEKKLK